MLDFTCFVSIIRARIFGVILVIISVACWNNHDYEHIKHLMSGRQLFNKNDCLCLHLQFY